MKATNRKLMVETTFKDKFSFLFEESKDAEPALVYPEEITYGQLRKAVWSVAGGLRALNIEPRSIVLPVLSKGKNFCAGYFAALISNTVPLLMETSSRVDLQNVARKVSLVIAEKSTLEDIQDIFPRDKVVAIDDLVSREASAGRAAGGFGRNEPMTILLTSGSTGDPKENIKSYGNVLDELSILKDIHEISPSDCYWCAVPWVHIYGFLNGFLLPLSERAKIASPGMFLPREVAGFIGRCSVFLGVPVQYRAMLETAGFGKGSLRKVFSSGAHLSEMISSRCCELTGIPVTELYGSTEMGGFAFRRSPLDKGWTTFPGADWKVGADSELFVRSPLMNESAFDSVPGAEAEDGWYPSGDCIKVLEDGTFRLDGRKGGIIKVGGKRVSIKEIEDGLFTTGLVSDAVVVSFFSAEAGCEKIGAAVVFKEGVEADRTLLRRKCCENLPPYKVPDRIVVVEKIPRAQTGKVRHSDIDGWMKKRGGGKTG